MIDLCNDFPGTSENVTDPGHDSGFLSTVYEAYGKHLNLRTSPDDWWYVITQTISLAIDGHSKEKEVRDFFVSHSGKKELEVKVGTNPLNITAIDYSWLFDQFAKSIEDNINKPTYVNQMVTDFTTTTKGKVAESLKHASIFFSP